MLISASWRQANFDKTTKNRVSDKKIVYESRIKVILLLTICWGFVVACFWTGYVWGLLFFGLCAVVTTYPLIDPRKQIIFIGTNRYKRQINKEFSERVEDLGIFRYSDKSFVIRLDRSNYDIQWTEIQSILGYKLDLLTTDEICLDIFCDNKISFTVTEETAGWFGFLKRIKEQFPTIEPDWSFNIQSPAFTTNLTLIYDRDNRTLEQVAAMYYNEGKKENKKKKWW
jgi:hypothetical protein